MIGNDRCDYVIIKDIGIPAGLTKEHRHDVQHGLKLGIGKQSAAITAHVSSVRPNVLTSYTYDEDGEITGVVESAMGWLWNGDLSAEGLTTPEESHTAFAVAIADYIQAPLAPVEDNISVEVVSKAGCKAELKVDAAFWRETVG